MSEGATVGGKRITAAGTRKPIFKVAFDSPYAQWPKVDESTEDEICNKFKRIITVEGETTKQVNWSSHLVLGLNAVCRMLEKGQKGGLAVLLACYHDVQPPHLLHHLPLLCRLAGCILISLPTGSAKELATLLSLPSILVIGLREAAPFIELVQHLRGLFPPPSDLSLYQHLAIQKKQIIPGVRKRKTKNTTDHVAAKGTS